MSMPAPPTTSHPTPAAQRSPSADAAADPRRLPLPQLTGLLTAPSGEPARRSLALRLATSACADCQELHALGHGLLLEAQAVRDRCRLLWTVAGLPLVEGIVPARLTDADIPALPPGVDGDALHAQAAEAAARLEPLVREAVQRVQAVLLQAPELAVGMTDVQHQLLGRVQQKLHGARLIVLFGCSTPVQGRYLLWGAAHGLLNCIRALCGLVRALAEDMPALLQSMLQNTAAVRLQLGREVQGVVQAMAWPHWGGLEELACTLLDDRAALTHRPHPSPGPNAALETALETALLGQVAAAPSTLEATSESAAPSKAAKAKTAARLVLRRAGPPTTATLMVKAAIQRLQERAARRAAKRAAAKPAAAAASGSATKRARRRW